MRTLQTYNFATVVCDGCARRIDSNFDGERLYDYDELIEWKLEDLDWQKVDENDDDKWLCPDCAKDKAHRKHPGEGRTILEKTPLFGLKCDLCGRTFEDLGGFTCWEDESAVCEFAHDNEWMEIGGKWYCPDCYCTCPAIEDDEMDWNEAEKRYCAKCPYEKDCNEVVPLDEPKCSPECNCVFKDEKGHWCRCPHYKSSEDRFRGVEMRCWLIADGGAECPRVAYWRDKGKPEQEAKNAKVLEECHLKEEDI